MENDLKAMGFSGPQVGRALERLLDQVIKDPEKNQREILLALAERMGKTIEKHIPF